MILPGALRKETSMKRFDPWSSDGCAYASASNAPTPRPFAERRDNSYPMDKTPCPAKMHFMFSSAD
jgi:hypothetical protein